MPCRYVFRSATDGPVDLIFVPCFGTKWINEEGGSMYQKLDDALVAAALKLFRTPAGVPNASETWHALRKAHHVREECFWGLFCPRAIQFFSEVVAKQHARDRANRVLRHLFPAEIRNLVGDSLVRLRGIPVRDFVEVWSAPRPELPVAGRACRCLSSTCSGRTVTRWCMAEHRWIIAHRTLRMPRTHAPPFLDIQQFGWEAVCKRESCDGHHNEDFAPNDWRYIPKSKVARWCLGERTQSRDWVRRSIDKRGI